MSRPDSTSPSASSGAAPPAGATEAASGLPDRPPTSHDVARLAGVSQSTVSLVMTGKDGVSTRSRERVLEASAALGYRPNLAARSMRTRQTGRLAIVMPITTYNPAPLLIGASAAASEAGFSLEVHSVAGGVAERAERMQSLVDSGQFEGFLTSSAVDVRQGAGDLPVVTLEEFDDQMRTRGELTDATPVTTIIEAVAASGPRRFLHVAGDLEYPSARARRDAFLATTRRLGLPTVGVSGGAWTGQAGYDAVRVLDEADLPLAVIAANDLVAAGVYRAVAERGWSIPGDVVVSGWDDLPQSEYLVPPLTTVRIDFQLLGARAVRRLVASVRSTTADLAPAALQEVIWRASTG